jgi:hypothetical protein
MEKVSLTKTVKVSDGIYLIKNFMPNENELIKNIEQECIFDKFTINNKILCRTGSFEGDTDTDTENESTPWLRCPSIEFQTINKWSNQILKIRNNITQLEEIFKTNCKTNIAKIQKYDNGDAFIYNHSDKIIDLDESTPIFIIRFGETRICKLINKNTKETLLVEMPHNTLLIMTYQANLEWTHGIIKEEKKGVSYSIVFRNSITYKLNNENLVYGKNTPFKTKNELFLSKQINFSNKNLYDYKTFKNNIIKAYNEENNNICDKSVYNNIIKYSPYAF